MDITIVTAGIIIKGEEILIAQRRNLGKEKFKWEFPGGKLENDEIPQDGLKREIKEELDITIEVDDIFEVVYHKDDEKKILLLCYLARYIKGTPKTLECNDFRWVKIKDLEKYDFSEADKKVLEKLLLKGLPN
ncbi:(deoxy)nucleoside triphosphate pyrophosphohydrolase [Caloranaerobacter ferrireducens]|uniref:(deoxy)nucleoside triphosphate pyrophosphohydrolase n=1 Tax=Caloranaerobacter ferrireducens TaxID=1323370 RepID=UPI00084CE7CB|nr:(deoxy)nucleoside triphosphate pyrophosphohydrolase [Caloranaerobacter ferrireducens]